MDGGRPTDTSWNGGTSRRIHRYDSYRLVITRSQPFFSEEQDSTETPENVVSELVVVDSLFSIRNIVESQFQTDILSTFSRRIVAKAMSSIADAKQLLLGADQLLNWYDSIPSSPREKRVAYRGPLSIAFKVGKKCRRVFYL